MPAIPKGIEPIVSGYSFQGPGGAARTEVAGGMARYALEYDRGVQPFNVTLLLKPHLFTIWSLFYHRTINKGTISFDMPLDSGLGKMTHSVNIVPGTYGASGFNGLMSVSFVVETESSVYSVDQETVDATLEYFDLYGPEMFLILPAIARFANSDSNVLQP